MPAIAGHLLQAIRSQGMSIAIRDVREHELDSVLALNNNAGLAILPLD